MILITGGTLIDPGSGKVGEFDLLIEKNIIADVQKRGAIPGSAAKETIDAQGRWIVPGLIDMHVHLREPGFEWKETIATGVEAAILGGYTTVCCMPNTRPVNDSAETTRFILDRAKSAGLSRVLPIGAVSIGLQGNEMAPLSELRKAGCVAFSDDGEPVWSAGLMRRALEWSRMLDAPICCHEEDKSLSCGFSMNESPLSYRLGLRGMPGVAEDVMVARDIELARFTGAKVHICHISTARGVELVRRAKNDGISVTAEVTPHHLMLTESVVANYDANYKMSPPLRSEEDAQALRTGLADGTIDAIASDHAPHEADSKTVEFDRATMGVLGLQTSLSLALELAHGGVIDKKRAVEALSYCPSRILGLDQGSLKKGAPADICIIDPEKRWVFGRDSIKSKSMNSPFLDREMRGYAECVIVDGRIVVSGGSLQGVA